MNKLKSSPCEKCERSKQGCGAYHDQCEEYQAYKKERERIAENRYVQSTFYREYIKSHKATYTSFNKKIRGR